MYQQKAQNVLKAFCRLEKNTCLYITGKGKGYQKLKAMVSELHLEGRVILTGWLEKPFAFMNLCDYFICPEGEEESLGTLAAKTMNMKLLAEDCTTEMPYSFQARSWNQEQCEKLDELIEGKRTSDE
ncbi:MAG: glycosyltransferase [Ruminococcus sp.]